MKLQTLAYMLSFAAALATISATAQETPKARPMTSAEKIAAIDTDRDGTITAAEHAAGARAMFERMDADRDGKVTAAEMDAAHQAMMSSGSPAKKANADDPPPNERPMDNKKKD